MKMQIILLLLTLTETTFFVVNNFLCSVSNLSVNTYIPPDDIVSKYYPVIARYGIRNVSIMNQHMS